jgi:GntR family transcriptional regulator, carbon starvation induced regulator
MRDAILEQKGRHPQLPDLDDPAKTLGEEAYSRLRADLIAGRLRPLEKLPFRQLSAKYGVGIGPLREALARLSSERLVQFEGQRGFVVAPASLEDLNDLCALRVDLYCRALRASIERGDEDWEAEIIVALHRLEKAPRPSSPGDTTAYDEWERRHDRFHNSLIAACGSSWLLHFCKTLSDQYQRYRRLNLIHMSGSEELWSGVRSMHRPIAEAVLDRNTDEAVRMITEHFESSVRRVIELHQQGTKARKAIRKK